MTDLKGDIGTWQNDIILHSMHEKAQMNTYEQFLVEKVHNNVTDVRKKKQRKGVFLVNKRQCFALFHFNFTNQNYFFVSVSSTANVANMANYHITI